MKTATFDVYHLYGTRGAMLSRILYRGNCVQSFDGPELEPILHAAKARGFTHWREGLQGRIKPMPDDVSRFMQLRNETLG